MRVHLHTPVVPKKLILYMEHEKIDLPYYFVVTYTDCTFANENLEKTTKRCSEVLSCAS